MAIKTVDEILNVIKARTEGQTDDETLQMVEDISDTLTDLNTRSQSANEWEQKYNDNDKAWRQKYKDRFLSASNGDNNPSPIDPIEPNEPDDKAKNYDDLFSHKK